MRIAITARPGSPRLAGFAGAFLALTLALHPAVEAQDAPPAVQFSAELDGGATLVGSAMGSMAVHAFVGRFGVGYRISMTERERTEFTRGGFFGATHPRESLRADAFLLEWAAPIPGSDALLLGAGAGRVSGNTVRQVDLFTDCDVLGCYARDFEEVRVHGRWRAAAEVTWLGVFGDGWRLTPSVFILGVRAMGDRSLTGVSVGLRWGSLPSRLAGR